MPEQSQDYALVVGINDYPRFGANGRPLKGAVQDATAFAKWLTNKNVGGGLAEDHCKLICSHPDPLEPLQLQIDDALEQIYESAKNTGARRFYFYFSGHGQAQDNDEVALCMANWSRVRRHAALSSTDYSRYVRNCTKFSEVMVFLDCCRVQSVRATGKRTELGCPRNESDTGTKNTFIAYATEYQKSAYEAVTGDDTDLEEEEGPAVNGFFTQALLAALYGGAASPTGGVTPFALQTYLEREVPRIAQENQRSQTPRFHTDLPTTSTSILGNALPSANYEIIFKPDRIGPIVLEGPTTEPIRRGPASSGPWHVTLEKGWHVLRDEGTGDEKPFSFRPDQEGDNRVEF